MADFQAKVLWRPERPQETNLWRFMVEVGRRRGLGLQKYDDIYRYSINRYTDFWEDCLQLLPIVYDGSYSRVVDPSARMDDIPRWFEGLQLNYAENILYTADSKSRSTRSKRYKEDDKVAVVEVREGQSSVKPLTWGELRKRVALSSTALKDHGLKQGDRVAAVVSNSIDTLCICLGAAALGAMFSTISTDMGINGILERLRQIKPKWVFVDDSAVYNGNYIELRGKMMEVINGMSGVSEFQGMVSVPRDHDRPVSVFSSPKLQSLSSFLAASIKSAPPEPTFTRVPFSTGFVIVYSSGTTGPPKCIVHGTGNCVVAGWKEFYLQRNLDQNARALQFTTTSWIMYLVAVQSLLLGARLIIYDGSPFHPHPSSFLDLACQQGVTYFGVSPRYLTTVQTAGVVPNRIPGIESLKIVTSTGMVLPQSLFRWFYSSTGFPKHVHLANISGGTDIAGALVDCSPIDPVYDAGGCQVATLAVDVRVYDSGIETLDDDHPPTGKEVRAGEPGDLVVPKPFLNMPVSFWDDAIPSSQGSKYRKAYFSRFAHVWTHGDFLYLDPATRAYVLLGRADGVLNPSGVRFGSAEIYTVLEAEFAGEIEDSVCVGQRRKGDVDERVLLFVKMREGRRFDVQLVRRVRESIARGLSRRHVPRFVFETREIPMTINAKKVELPLKRIVSGERVVPSGTLANPKSLEFYYQFVDPEEVEARLRKSEAAERRKTARL